VKTSKPSLRAIATSVIPAASAIRIASAVGADTATIIGALIAADFCTSPPRPGSRLRSSVISRQALYFKVTLDVIEATTSDAILNCASLSSIS
jgi:hypothetical protein